MRACLQFVDELTFGRAAASHIGRCARKTLAWRPAFRMALSGGKSPLPAFHALTDPVIFPPPFWARTHIFLADERLGDPGHAHSNFRSIKEHLLDLVPIPAANMHPVPMRPDPESAAREYSDILLQSFGGTPVFDLVVLGMGADGHTASLFPHGPLLAHTPCTVAPVPAPDLEPRLPRLTLTPLVLNAAREVLFLVLGQDKHAAVRAILDGNRELPAARVDARPQTWYVSPPLSAATTQ
ncbi:MAG: 6-phosphogluconolactonase [Desulfovibrionales bacterium]|nr:6-phosphogluconolactonase [Desulfovibrionales bacterium]